MVTVKKLFTKEDCEYIKSFYNFSNEKNEKGFKIVTEKYPQGIAIKDGSVVSWNELQNEKLDHFILEKLKVENIVSLPLLKLMRYSVGSEMKPHRDFQAYDTNTIYRSLTIQLSDESDYVGGELYVAGVKATKEQGNFIMFNPNDEHWVTKITEGERWVIVLFLEESNFNLKKSMI